MKKRVMIYISILVFCALVSLLSVLPLQHPSSDNSSWMSKISDDTHLNALTIPGTHDSGALHSIADVSGKCQTLSISDQLKIGVRFLDIRLRLVKNELMIVHSFVDQNTKFEDVLSDINKFLIENPSEFLIVSIKKDADPISSDVLFGEKLEELLLDYKNTVSDSRSLPKTVGEARGKLYVIARYQNSSIGLPCYGGWIDDASFTLGNIYIQDNYSVDSPEEKLKDILKTFDTSASGEYELILNYTSCYKNSGFPPIYAGLPAHFINENLCKKIPDYKHPLGVLICDFVTSDLADIIIERNFD